MPALAVCATSGQVAGRAAAAVRHTVTMALSKKLLGEGERIVVETRTHWKHVLWPAVLFVLLCFATGAGLALGRPLMPDRVRPWGTLAIVVVALLAFLAWCVAPFSQWLTTTYTITTRRLITRSGILTTRGHDLPLVTITNVTYERSFTDRLLGCGSLTMTTAAEEPLTLVDIPDVERVHLTMTELLFSDSDGRDGRDRRAAT